MFPLATASGAHAPGGDTPWRGEYFNDMDRAGSPALERDDPAPFGFEVNLSGGRHQVEVAYLELTGNAQFQDLLVPAQPSLTPVGSFVGQYFANASLTGNAGDRADSGVGGA